MRWKNTGGIFFVGAGRHANDADDAMFRGTAVGFRSPHHFLTCAHVVEGLDPEDIWLAQNGSVRIGRNGKLDGVTTMQMRFAAQITPHDTADLAIITMSAVVADLHEPVVEVVEAAVGEPVQVYGFTRNTMQDAGAEMAPLTLTASGTSVRQISELGSPPGQKFKFASALLDTQVDIGMSGGPVFALWPYQKSQLVALSTGENSEGHGWALRLAPYRSWLEANIRCEHGVDDWELPEFRCSAKSPS